MNLSCLISVVSGESLPRVIPVDNPVTENMLQTLTQEVLPELMHSITSKNTHSELRITEMTGDVQGHESTQYLLKAYEETTSEGVRCKILEAIGKSRDRAQLKWLSERLDDRHVSIQCFAIWALGELHDPRASIMLRRKLWSSEPYVQMTALDAMGKMPRNPSAALEIAAFLRVKNVQVRYLAAKALFSAAGPEMAQELIQRLTEEKSLEVQEALARTLGHAGESVGAKHLIELLKSGPSQATEHWIEIGLRSVRPAILVPALLPIIEGNDFRLKLAAARVLGELDMPIPQESDMSWMEQVMRWAKGRDLILRVAAARLLERMKVNT